MFVVTGLILSGSVELVRIGAVHPPEMRLFALSDAVEAHKISEGRHFRGKLVFVVR